MVRSFVLSNGNLAAAFDDFGRARDLHAPALGVENHLLGRVCRLALVVDGTPLWFHEMVHGGWRRAGGGFELQLSGNGCGIVVRQSFAIHPDEPILFRRFLISHAERRERLAALLLHHDFDVGETDIGNGVRFDADLLVLEHSRRDRILAVGAMNPRGLDHVDWTLGRRDEHGGQGVCAEAARVALSRNPVAMGATESLLKLPLRLPPGGDAEVVVFTCFAATHTELRTRAGAARAHSPEFAGAAEAALREGNASADDFDAAARESLAVVLAHVDDGGGIVASLDSDVVASARDTYAYVWPRDAALIADSLRAEGLFDPARRFALWAMRALEPGGYYMQRYDVLGRRGSTWHNVLDPASGRLPIQEDETALTVWAVARLAVFDPGAPGEDLVQRFIRPAADFLARFRHPHLPLPQVSHDLWEERLGIHLFTVLAVIAGLRRAARAALHFNHDSLAVPWEEAAAVFERGIERHFYHDDAGRYGRSLTPRPDGSLHLDVTPDASMYHLALLDEVVLDSRRTEDTLRALDETLAVHTAFGGVARYADDHYWRKSHDVKRIPGNPWAIAEAWRIRARMRRRPAPAAPDLERQIQHLLARRTGAGMLAEQWHPVLGEPISVCPLAWSHASVVDLIRDYRAALAVESPSS